MSLVPDAAAPDAAQDPLGTLTDPKVLLRVPVGLASPLWPLFAGAAVSGAAWWWMTRWAQPANLEAMFGAAAKAEAEAASELVAQAQPLAGAGPAIEAAAEAFVEAAAAAAPAPILETIGQEPASFAPVGGESAPISSVLEAVTPEVGDAPEAGEAPKPRKRPSAPAAD